MAVDEYSGSVAHDVNVLDTRTAGDVENISRTGLKHRQLSIRSLAT